MKDNKLEDKLAEIIWEYRIGIQDGNRPDRIEARNKIENLELWNTMQPAGQRVEDKLKYANKIIELYA